MNAHIFISYSHKDGTNFAHRLKRDLEANSFNVWMDIKILPGERWDRKIDEAIDGAECVLVLLTPEAVESQQVEGEWQRAMNKSKKVIPLRVLDSDVPRTLDTLQWLNFTDLLQYEAKFTELVRLLNPDIPSITVLPYNTSDTIKEEWFHFKDRDETHEKIGQGLVFGGGEDFFVITGGPKMGKTWFLGKLQEEGPKRGSSLKWFIRRVNLAEDREACGNAQILLSRYLKQPVPPDPQEDWLNEKAQELNEMHHRVLWLMDDAHFLDEPTQKTFRYYLHIIHEYILNAGPSGSCFGFVAATRQYPRYWRGISPRPEFIPIELQQLRLFDIDKMLEQMLKKHSRDESPLGRSLKLHGAKRLLKETQGIPELLYRYIKHIEDHFATDITKRQVFDELAIPYIQEFILKSECLLPHDPSSAAETKTNALVETLRLLCAYRIFVEVHLSHVYDEQMEPTLKEQLQALGWENPGLLYDAVQYIYLNRYRDNKFYWEFYPPIRRLLFRYFYPDEACQITIHKHARDFYNEWRKKATDHHERIRYTIEYLWHISEIFRLQYGDEKMGIYFKPQLKDGLYEIIEKRNTGIISGLGKGDLIDRIQQEVEDDNEFKEMLSALDDGFFGDLIDELRSNVP